MKKIRKCLCFFWLAVTLNLVPMSNLLFVHPTSAIDPPVDLNHLMLQKFVEWDAFLTRYLSSNGTLYDPFDYSRVTLGHPNTQTSSGVGFYILALANMYSQTGNSYYLSKLRVIIDAVINNDFFYKDVGGIGEIFYVPQFYYGGYEHDSTCKLTMAVGIACLKLFEWTTETLYMDTCDRIASESLRLAVFNNSTDMAWSWAYYQFRDETNAKMGVNRQGAIAWFYALYGQRINSTYLVYVPRIVNWIWRSQLSSGGLSYTIGGTKENSAYTAFSLYFALNAYNLSSNFSSDLKSKISNSLAWLGNKAQLSLRYLETSISASSFLAAWKTDYFASEISTSNAKSFVYISLIQLNFSSQGVVTTLSDYPFGWRWQQYFVGALFSLYPLPDGFLASLTGVSFYESWEGEYVPTGWMLNYIGNNIFDGGNGYGVGFRLSGRLVYSLRVEGVNPADRNVSILDSCLRVRTRYSTGANVTMFVYPSGIYVSDVNGTGRIWISLDYSAKWKLMVENGTTYDVSNFINGSSYVLSKNFLLWLNETKLMDRRTIFASNPKTTFSYETDGTTFMRFSTVASNYRVIFALLISWGIVTTEAQAHSTLVSMSEVFNIEQPILSDVVLSDYTTRVSFLVTYPSWLDVYKAAIQESVKLIAHTRPEDCEIGSWEFASKRLTVNMTALSGNTSTLKIYCDSYNKPMAVSVNNVEQAIDYDYLTQTLTLEVVHIGVSRITVYWKIPGDANDDGLVDVHDLARIGKAYGATPDNLNWDDKADIDGDGVISNCDLALCSENYAKTGT